MDFTLMIEGLRQAKCITPLEKDILDTWNELQKNPFDRSAAQKQVVQNNAPGDFCCNRSAASNGDSSL